MYFYANQAILQQIGKKFIHSFSEEKVAEKHSNDYFQFLYNSNFTVNSSGYEKPAEFKLRQLLKELRIAATIHQIPEWTGQEEFIRHGSVLKLFTENSEEEEQIANLSEENINRSKLYMQR